MTVSSATATVVTAPTTVVRPQSRQRAVIYGAGALYGLLAVATILRHEPWADEAQAWLLARDASLSDLWLHLLHYEGSPGLWHTLLHVLIGFGLPYAAYNFVSGILGFAAAWLFFRYAPLPLPIRVLIPFTYFIAYQYAVVARSYALMAPLLFLVALIYREAAKRPVLLTILLCLIAGISVHGVILSGCIWLVVASRAVRMRRDLTVSERRRWLLTTAIYGAAIVLFMLSAWPAKDVAFAESRGLPNFTLDRLVLVAKVQFAEAFTGEWISSLAVVALSLRFLWKGRGALIFLPVTVFLWAFGAIVYSNEWHYGIILLAWLFAIWVSAQRVRLTRPAIAALAAVIAVQCYWTIAAVTYDWQNAYSGSAEAARYLQKTPLKDLAAVSYPATALEPYFSANIYSNFHNGARTAYWDWSKRNSANPENDRLALLSTRHRDYVLVGYRLDYEKAWWSNVLLALGYQELRHFGGNLFWHDRILEPEAFDLYHRIAGAAALSPAASSLDLGASSSQSQLLTGYYDVEENAWRWTAKHFSAVLRTPPFAARSGARLVFRFYLPGPQISKLGPITLSGDLDGYPLVSNTYRQGGRYEYSVAVPPEALAYDLVAVNLRFDKAAIGLYGDHRELGAVASSLALETQ
jgi:hypothetical protein